MKEKSCTEYQCSLFYAFPWPFEHASGTTQEARIIFASKLPSFRFSSKSTSLCYIFQPPRGWNTPRIWYPFLSWGLVAINLRYPRPSALAYPTPSANSTGIIIDQNQHFCLLVMTGKREWHHKISFRMLQMPGIMRPSINQSIVCKVLGLLGVWGLCIVDSPISSAQRYASLRDALNS